MKVVKYIVVAAILFIVGALGYVKYALPNIAAAPDIRVEMTPENIERGRYLANHVTLCIDCHATRDWSKFAGPPVEGTYGMGGELFDQKFGFPGKYTSKNITPYGIGDWTDGELFRTITTGVNKKGEALFPVMPFHYYGQMDEEDIKCIIAYIKTLKSIESHPEESASDFPMSLIINTIPHEANFQKIPEKSDVVNYGKYMANASACMECHTQVDKGQVIPELAYSGGREFVFPDGSIIRSANITGEKETGIGSWSKDFFVQLFKSRSDSVSRNIQVKPGDYNTMMPWTMYGGMTKEDLGAIYEYLRSVKQIKNDVVKYTPAN